jgi:hypothetical protein
MKLPKAYIKKEFDLKELEKYGYFDYKQGNSKFIIKPVGDDWKEHMDTCLIVSINLRSRRLRVSSPFGDAAFINTQEQFFKELADLKIVEYKDL